MKHIFYVGVESRPKVSIISCRRRSWTFGNLARQSRAQRKLVTVVSPPAINRSETSHKSCVSTNWTNHLKIIKKKNDLLRKNFSTGKVGRFATGFGALHLNQIVVHHRFFNFGYWRFFSLILELANELLEIEQPLDDDHQQPESVVPNQVPNAV